MLLILRLVIWLFAIVLAAGPLLVTVARSPSLVGNLLTLSAYSGAERDILFLSISVLAIGLVDVFACMASYSVPDANSGKVGFAMSILLAVAHITQLIVYSFWSATIKQSASDLRTLPYIFTIAVATSFSARLTLIFGAAE